MKYLNWRRVLVVTMLLAAGAAGCKKSAPKNSGGSAAANTVAGSGSNGAAMNAGAGSAAGSNIADGSGSAAGSAADNTATEDPDDENNPRNKAALALLKDEAIGGIHMEMTDKEVIAVLGQPSKKGKAIEEGATGETVAQWEWKKAGINVLFTDANKTPKVRGIGLSDPSALKTKQGVGIGSRRAELDTAYGAGQMKSTDDGADAPYTVGNHYYGLVFSFEGGKVKSAYWGTLAE